MIPTFALSALLHAGRSDKLCLFKKEEEWAFLHWGGIDEGGLVELAVVPELQPFEIVRAHLDIVVHPAVLEEELLVAPVRANRIGAADQPSDQAVFAAELGRLVEGEHLEHGGVDRDDRHLVLKVVLVLVRPPEDVIWLDIQLIWPVRVFLFVTVLVEQRHVHD